MTMTSTMPMPVRPAGAAAPDLSDFVLANRALRSGARLLADAVSAIAAGAGCSQERKNAIVWFAEHVLHEVAEHHRKEDDILWPVIVDSTLGRVDLDELCDEHGVLDGVLHRATNLLRIFDTHGPSGARTFAAVLTELADDLDQHITRDEQRLFPVIRQYVSVRDFDRCRARCALHHPSAHRRFVRAWLADTAGADVRSRRQWRWARRYALVAGQI
jgi:hemerythrin-like domain-containing protein